MPTTYRDLFKWGSKEIEETLDDNLISILGKRINFKPKEIEKIPDSEPIDYNVRCKLDEKFITNLIEIVTKENLEDDPRSILGHGMGSSYTDALRIREREFKNYPDLVVYPKEPEDIEKIIDLCNLNQIPIIPTGGQTSVTEGISFPNGGISLDLKKHMNQVVSVNKIDNTITAQAGILGPDLEKHLNDLGYTCGHFPQSFEFSTLGGWVSTRAAGQESTGYGKIEDLVTGLKLLSPVGELKITPYPAKAVGPDLLEIVLGSEGAFGVITEVTMKIHPIQVHNEYGAFLLKSFDDGINAVREIMQGRFGKPFLFRLSDPEETDIYLEIAEFGGWKEWIVNKLGYEKGKRVLLMISTSGRKNYAKLIMKNVKKVVSSNNGRYVGSSNVKMWLEDRFHTPYLRDTLMDHDVVIDTLETSTTWSNIKHLWSSVRDTVKSRSNTIAMTHLSHMYEDGANLYFIFMSKTADENRINDYINYQKSIIQAIVDNGGSLSHHHGIGRLFNPWLEIQVGSTGKDLLDCIKHHLDPNDIMNPGVLGG